MFWNTCQVGLDAKIYKKIIHLLNFLHSYRVDTGDQMANGKGLTWS